MDDKPYFGPDHAALQGVPRRHAYMQAIVKKLAGEGRDEQHVLEIGSWAGGSAITWAKALQRHCRSGQVVCVDHWKPYLDLAVNTKPVYKKMDDAAHKGLTFGLFCDNVKAAGVENVVVTVMGRSIDTLPLLRSDYFDVVFIDGSHAREDVDLDIGWSIRLIRDGGIICGDDLELQLHQCDMDHAVKAAQEGRDYVPHPTTKRMYHPGVTLAVHEWFGEVSCWEGLWAMRRRGHKWEQFELTDVESGFPDHLK